MMKKSIRYMLTIGLVMGMSALLAACGERKIVAPENEQPYTEITEGIQIDWDQVNYDFTYAIDEAYPEISSYIDFEVIEDKKTIRLIWPLQNTATQLDAINNGAGYIKMFNDIVATQDFSIAKSSENYYGGLWDRYTLQLEIFKEEDLLFPEKYYVNQEIDPGSNAPVLPQIISDVDETASIDSTIEPVQQSE
jgi:outer membrane protein H.8